MSKSTIHRLVVDYGGALAAQWQEEAEHLWGSGVRGEELPPPREGQQAETGISLDGVMVWVEDGWHEVKVGSCFGFGPGEEGEVKARDIGYRAGYRDVRVCLSAGAGGESGGDREWRGVD